MISSVIRTRRALSLFKDVPRAENQRPSGNQEGAIAIDYVQQQRPFDSQRNSVQY